MQTNISRRTYNCRKTELEPSERLSVLIQDISSGYIGEGKNKLNKYVDVRKYDGACNTTTVYRIIDHNIGAELPVYELIGTTLRIRFKALESAWREYTYED